MISASYLFDIFLGPSYNQSPPSVKYMTVSSKLCFSNLANSTTFQTNGGKYRFNPNLYAVRQLAGLCDPLTSVYVCRMAKCAFLCWEHGRVLVGSQENPLYSKFVSQSE